MAAIRHNFVLKNQRMPGIHHIHEIMIHEETVFVKDRMDLLPEN